VQFDDFLRRAGHAYGWHRLHVKQQASALSGLEVLVSLVTSLLRNTTVTVKLVSYYYCVAIIFHKSKTLRTYYFKCFS